MNAEINVCEMKLPRRYVDLSAEEMEYNGGIAVPNPFLPLAPVKVIVVNTVCDIIKNLTKLSLL
jgi:hypothetical protein